MNRLVSQIWTYSRLLWTSQYQILRLQKTRWDLRWSSGSTNDSKILKIKSPFVYVKFHSQEMETDKNEEAEKKKRKFLFLTLKSVCQQTTMKGKSWFLLFSSKVWFHQGKWEGNDASGEGETGDRCLPRDHHHSESPFWLLEHFSAFVSSLTAVCGCRFPPGFSTSSQK